MQIVHTMTGNYLRAQAREGIQSNGDSTYGGYIYRDTFVHYIEENVPLRMQIEVGSEDGILPAVCDFDNYTVTVTVDITPNE